MEVLAVGTAVLLIHPARSNVGFDAKDRLDPLLLSLHIELHDAEHDAVVRDRHTRHAELYGAVNEVRNSVCAVEQRILGVVMEVDEVRGHSGLVKDGWGRLIVAGL